MSEAFEMTAVVPVRDGYLPAGATEAIVEAGRDAVLIGTGLSEATEALRGVAESVRLVEAGDYAPAGWAELLAPLLASANIVVLPASPDGRDLAPRLAAELERPLFASALQVKGGEVAVAAFGGRAVSHHNLSTDAVVTLQPGVRSVELTSNKLKVESVELTTGGNLDDQGSDASSGESTSGAAAEGAVSLRDAVVDSVLPPDIATMDLSEAPRLLGGGAGLDSAEKFDQLRDVAASLDASMGATRVITDRGWISHNRQIGTTGVVVDPDLYIAFGISGAVQHTAGLGHPEHVISVNTDEHCPMMELADLAIVVDANATLDELGRLLGSGSTTATSSAVEPATGATEAQSGGQP